MRKIAREVPTGASSKRPCTMPFMPFHGKGPPGQNGRTPPTAETSEEAAYLKALGEKQKLVSIKLADGAVVRGWIEYDDKNIVGLTVEWQRRLFISHNEIMYTA